MQPALLDKLHGIVGNAHVLTGIDLSPYVIEGRTPVAAVFPGTIDEVRAVVGLAADAEMPLIPWGGGTAGSHGVPPARAGIVVGLRRLAALVEHEPGDLTVTAQAGMTVASLQATLGTKGQWLSLDPPDADRATLGGVVAANASGPRRHLYGTARDLLIGVTVVTADGQVVRGGGKVVKNVAGYDLPKLFIGSCGTLGVIVETTLKLRPVPDQERLVAVRFERMKDGGAAVRALLASDLIPNAVELLDGEASRAFGLREGAPTLVVGFDGLAEQVQWQHDQLLQLATACGGRGAEVLAQETWPRLAGAPGTTAGGAVAVMTFAVLPTLVAETIEHGADVARHHGLPSAWSAHAGVGIVRAALASTAQRQDPSAIAAVLGGWRDMVVSGGGHATLTWAPLAVKALVPVWDDLGPAGRIMQRIKERLDPKNILNPGRFVAGI